MRYKYISTILFIINLPSPQHPMMRGLIVLLAAVACCYGQGRRGRHLSKVELWPNRDVGQILSMNYPHTLPPNFDHEWIINGVPNSVILLRCSEVYQVGSCSENNMTVIDGSSSGVVCGTRGDVMIESRGPSLHLFISTGSMGGSRVNCVASSSLRYGNIPSYLTDVSREIDSREHGVTPGRKETTCPCGWTNKPHAFSRIVGGSETGINEYPLAISLVEIMNRSAKGFSYFRFCGGTIISPWHVLTAAHCTLEYVQNPRKELAIIVGDHDHTRWDETDANELIMIEKTLVHESYNPRITVYDISLLKTRTQIKFGPKVGPACLPTGPMNLQGQYVKGVGWGLTSHPGTGSNVLKKTWIQILPLDTCKKYYPPSIQMTNQHQLCVFGKERGLCMGDSGGPVIWLDPATNRYTLVGVVSFGRSCSNFYPDVVTDVSSLLPWVKRNIAATMPATTCSAK